MYDPGLEVWGGENLELSFKTWMCGGRIEIVQCSHVGHVYRKKSPYNSKRSLETVRSNSLRVAKVWMDDYIKYFYYATEFNNTECGSIIERTKLREELQCKSFEWYLQEIYPFRTIPSDGISFGRIENVAYNKSMCLNAKASKDSSEITIAQCSGELS
jgi:polypeptide N-acetylgalactosaminyltransferase